MKRKTKAQVPKLKLELHKDLHPYVDLTTGILDHPLISIRNLSNEPNVQEINRLYTELAARRNHCLAEVRVRPLNYIALHQKHYRLFAFYQIRHLISDAQYWRMLEYVWTISEYLFQNKNDWLLLLSATRRYRGLMMQRADRKFFAGLPDELTIFRGYREGQDRHGLSWTLSQAQATRFANRNATGETGKPIVLVGRCAKVDVFCYTNGREEDEIIIDPAKITDIREVGGINQAPLADSGH